MNAESPQFESAGAQIFHPDDAEDREALRTLRTRRDIDVIDQLDDQRHNLAELLPRPDTELLGEPHRWVYYPWRRALVSVLGPRAFRRVRLDRNRNLVTAEEQSRLGSLRIGIVGLSVGHAIAHTLVTEGLCGQLRVTDFDELELTNLNRVPASVLDLGVNKAVVAARRVAEIDPYVELAVLRSGLNAQSIDSFLDGCDIIVEECDSLDMKVLVRQAARARRQPVLMASSDRGLIDVERFDEEPERPVLHGLLGDADLSRLATLSSREKIPYVLQVIEASKLSARGAAALVEIGQTLSTWPQLAGDVLLGATAVARAVRRIGLGEPLNSGRIRIDVDEALGHLLDPAAETGRSHAPATPTDESGPSGADVVDLVAAAAIRAPSGGNTQPWRITTKRDGIEFAIAPECTSMMDVSFRASAIALGAATFNARVAAAAHGQVALVNISETSDNSPLQALITLAPGGEAELAQLYKPMLDRHTNRHSVNPADPIEPEQLALLAGVAEQHRVRLAIIDGRDQLERVAAILGTADRVRYLTPRLHAEMVSELRWPHDDCQETGIDVNSLEVGHAGLQAMEILRRPDVMDHLAAWNIGGALGDDSRARVRGSSAVAVVIAPGGGTLLDYARGGAALEAVWIAAQKLRLAVHPVSPVFLYARTNSELHKLAPKFAAVLTELQREFRALIRLQRDEAEILVLRLTADAPQVSIRSRRRTNTLSGR